MGLLLDSLSLLLGFSAHLVVIQNLLLEISWVVDCLLRDHVGFVMVMGFRMGLLNLRVFLLLLFLGVVRVVIMKVILVQLVVSKLRRIQAMVELVRLFHVLSILVLLRLLLLLLLHFMWVAFLLMSWIILLGINSLVDESIEVSFVLYHIRLGCQLDEFLAVVVQLPVL